MSTQRPRNRFAEALGATIAALLCIAILLGLIAAIAALLRWILG